ncbi:MAG TPA: hypothetical protein VIT21_04070 [Chthoniobacterales bacterium]
MHQCCIARHVCAVWFHLRGIGRAAMQRWNALRRARTIARIRTARAPAKSRDLEPGYREFVDVSNGSMIAKRAH